MIDRQDSGTPIGKTLLDLSDRMFAWWHLVRNGTLTRSSFQVYISGLRAEVREALAQGTACGCPQTAATCRELLSHEPKLWAFVWHEGVEPTNNAAERALRHAVLWRKGSGGTDSSRGSRFVERVLSVRETYRQQGRGLLEYLVGCCQAHLEGKAPPSLLPEVGSQLEVARVPSFSAWAACGSEHGDVPTGLHFRIPGSDFRAKRCQHYVESTPPRAPVSRSWRCVPTTVALPFWSISTPVLLEEVMLTRPRPSASLVLGILPVELGGVLFVLDED
jgi:transposase